VRESVGLVRQSVRKFEPVLQNQLHFQSVSFIVREEDENIKQQSHTKQNEEELAQPSESTIKTKWFLKYPQRESTRCLP
jgi:hypothetical protein